MQYFLFASLKSKSLILTVAAAALSVFSALLGFLF